MQAIKALVLGMGVLIIAGLALLGYGFYSQADHLDRRTGKAAPSRVVAGTFGEVVVPMPAGARAAEVTAVGDRLAVRVAEPDGERLIILDPAAGAIAGSFLLRASPAAAAPGAVPLR